MSELSNGERVADVAARYEVSAAAIYRHQRNHAVVMSTFDIDTDSSLSLVDRLVGIMARAQKASQMAYERGDLRAGALIGDAAIRAANSLQNFGVNSEKVRADIAAADAHRRRARALAQAVEIILNAHPEIVEPLADAAEQVGGLDEIVQTLRAERTTEEENSDG